MQGHTFAVENFDIVGQAENVGILVVISGRSLDVGPVGEVDGNQSFGCGQFYDFRTGSRLVNILSQKIVDLVVLVRNVKTVFSTWSFSSSPCLGRVMSSLKSRVSFFKDGKTSNRPIKTAAMLGNSSLARRTKRVCRLVLSLLRRAAGSWESQLK